MRLRSITIQLFRNFVQAQTIAVESDVTVLVGKNESGKTTILKALHRLNPANLSDTEFDLTTEYPRWRLSRDRKKNAQLAGTRPVSAVFELTTQDVAALSDALPAPPPDGARCKASRSYENKFYVELEADVPAIVRKAAETAELTT